MSRMLLAPAQTTATGVRASSPSLEDLFVSLTGEGFDVSG